MPVNDTRKGYNARRRRLILASGSPRRRRLIKAIDIPIRIVGSGDDEPNPGKDESPNFYVQRLAVHKANHALNLTRNDLVLGADTSVVIDNDILGKPSDSEEAIQMLERLRGRPHEVITGIALLDSATNICSTAVKASKVYMRDYSNEEIAAYVESGEPFDKAGAYAAQDETFRPASGIEGCFANVVGLPVCDVLTLLERIGVPTVFRRGWQVPSGCSDCDYWKGVTAKIEETNRQ